MYVKTSKLGAAQIHWLSELALYDFDIVYHTGRSNLVADALSHRPEAEGENHNQTCSDNDDEEWQAISYSAIYKELQGIIGGVKVEHSLRERIQVVQSAEDDIHGSCKIEVVAGMVDVFHQVPSTTMVEHQAKDYQLAPVLEWVHDGKQPTKVMIYQVRSKNTRQLMYQFHRLILKMGFHIAFTSIMMWNTTNWCYLKGTIKKFFSHSIMISVIKGLTEHWIC